MRTIAIVGNHPRHLYLLNALQESNFLDSIIIEKRGAMLPETPNIIDKNDLKNWVKHFKNREKFELLNFPISNKFDKHEQLFVENINKSQREIILFIKEQKPDVALIFGVSIIKEPIFSELPGIKINLHSGFLPEFKGSAGNFWPFYFLKPNYVGMTFHFLTSKLDAGEIIHQSQPTLNYGETIHEVSCNAMLLAFIDAIKILEVIKNKKDLNKVSQTKNGKLFKNNDFLPHHLRIIYDDYNDKIVDHFLDNKIQRTEPNFIKMIF